MTPSIRLTLVLILVGSSNILMAQFGIITPNESKKVHIQKIDSLDEQKKALLNFKKRYAHDTAVKVLDTTLKYVLRFSDTIKHDRSSRRLDYGGLFFQNSIYQMASNSNLYYLSRTYRHEPTTFSAKQILELYQVQNMWLVPVIPDSIVSQSQNKPSNTTYYDYFVPYIYDNKILVLKQTHSYHGYNSVGLVSFSNQINHYFEVLE
ncbi:MAG: hypothetical protein ACI9JN_000901 [Bacteroidia bacterium]|jgi:hypothetical protein